SSSSVRNSRSANSAGRSSGVMFLPFQMPDRSGVPHGVRGRADAASSFAGPLPATGVRISHTLATTMATSTMAATTYRLRTWDLLGVEIHHRVSTRVVHGEDERITIVP